MSGAVAGCEAPLLFASFLELLLRDFADLAIQRHRLLSVFVMGKVISFGVQKIRRPLPGGSTQLDLPDRC